MIDAAAYKNALGSFPTGVCVLTMPYNDSFHGVTISSLSAVSLSPPLVSFCIEHQANSYAILQKTDQVAVNILGYDQQDLCWHFAKHGQWQDDFAYEIQDGFAVFKNIAAGLLCTIKQRITAGDHDIFISQVDQSLFNESITPLAYCRGKVGYFTQIDK